MEKAGKTFEEKLQRLEEIVRALENGQLPLEDSLRLYEEGAALLMESQRELEQAEQRISEWKLPDRAEEEPGE